MIQPGMPVNRTWVLTLNDGVTIIDWGEGVFQDVLTGDFVDNPVLESSHTALDDELELLKRAGRLSAFDGTSVYLNPLPEKQKPAIE